MKNLLAALTLILLMAEAAFAQDTKAAEIKKIESVAAKGPFQPNWKSLENYKIPDWYQDAKFGIFIHWGVYSVPGFGNEWYPRRMYDANDRGKIQERHIATFGPLTVYGEGATKVTEGPFAERNRKDFTADDIRFTTRGDTLYAISLDWPRGATLTIKSLPTGSAQKIKRVQMLGAKGDLKWSQSKDGLTITLPAQPVGQHAFTFKVSAK